eukprot:8231330-Ditylum_brightwellii.AAC.1
MGNIPNQDIDTDFWSSDLQSGMVTVASDRGQWTATLNFSSLTKQSSQESWIYTTYSIVSKTTIQRTSI